MIELKCLGQRIKRLNSLKMFSSEDDCFVALANCVSCQRLFFEEFEHGMMLAICGLPSVCIRCDEKACARDISYALGRFILE